MSLPELTLTTEKNQRNVQANRLTVRESEKGLTLVANIVSGNGLPYDLTGLTLQFCENKQDGKAIIDPAVSVLDSKNGRISYVLHSQAYACSGSAWFEILSGTTLVDSTQNFSIKVESTTNVNVDSSDYIWDTQLENLRTQLQTLVDTMNTTTLPTLNANISAASAKVAQLQQNLNNVDWLSYVKSVNGRKPDSNGDLKVSECGENLLLNTSDYSNNWAWNVTPSIDTTQKPAILHYPSTTITSGMSAIAQQNIGSILQPSTTYTFSFYAKGSGNFRFYCYPSVAETISSVNGVAASSIGVNAKIPLTSIYVRYTITFTTLSNISGGKTLLLRQDYDPNSPTCEAYMYGMKLEKGSVATDWSVNPAEILTQSDYAKIKAAIVALGGSLS